MAKNKISEFDATASGNTDIGGININEGCPPSTINNAIRQLMSDLKNQQTGADGDGFSVSGTLTSSGTLAVTGGVTVDGAAGTSGQFLTSAGTGNTPTWTTLTAFVSGMIMLWSGSTGSIPSGWLLCDGTSSTPDLRDRFVVGAGGTYAVDATGGSADAVVVSHTHTATSTDSGHTHVVPQVTDRRGAGFGTLYCGNGNVASGTGFANITTTNSTEGVSGTNANLPPYYALAYIMKA